MDFSNKCNLAMAKLALGDALELFDLSNPKDNAAVVFAVKAYLSPAVKPDTFQRIISNKMSEIGYDSRGMLKPEYVMTEREEKYLAGFGNLNSLLENNNGRINVLDSSENDPHRL